MMKIILVVIIFLTIPAISKNVFAQQPPPKMVCEKKGKDYLVNPGRVLQFYTDGIEKSALDKNNDISIDWDEMRRAVVFFECNKERSPSCTKSLIDRALDSLELIEERTDYKISSQRKPNSNDIVEDPVLAEKLRGDIVEDPVLAKTLIEISNQLNRFFAKGLSKPIIQMKCSAEQVATFVKKEKIDSSATNDPFLATEPKDNNGEENVKYAIVIRGKVDDLFIEQEKKGAFAKASTADFSITSDKKKNTTEYQATTVLGLQMSDFSQDPDLYLSLIPYLKYERRLTSGDTGDDPDQEIDNISFGLLGYGLTTSDFFGAHEFSIAPQFTTDSEAETQIAAVNFNWIPIFPFMRTTDFAPLSGYELFGPVAYRFDADVNLSVGQVIDDGGNTNLDDTEEFVRIGGLLGVNLRLPLIEMLAPLTAKVSYLILNGAVGELDTIERLEASLSYTLTPGFFTIKAKYVNGRVDDTLADTEYWNLSLGVKY